MTFTLSLKGKTDFMVRRPTFTIGSHCYEAPPQKPGLYIVATPIGHLEDITLRALKTLSAVDFIFCEDQRVTRKLLMRYAIKTPLKTYNDHNAPHARAFILKNLTEGKSLALVSDAGTPLISDPGYKLIQACYKEGIFVETIPGASAPVAALTLSGFPPDRFCFCGFFPKKQADMTAIIEEVKTTHATFVFFESPNRLKKTLQHLADTLPKRSICLLREMTKLHQERLSGVATDLLITLDEREAIYGEICLLISPESGEETREITHTEIKAAVKEASGHLKLSKACALVAKNLQLPKREVYQIMLDDQDALTKFPQKK